LREKTREFFCDQIIRNGDKFLLGRNFSPEFYQRNEAVLFMLINHATDRVALEQMGIQYDPFLDILKKVLTNNLNRDRVR
jgi:hypothetical protein